MNDLTSRDLIGLFEAMADAIETEKDRLSALDGVIGDGDHGVTMSIGLSAVMKALGEPEVADGPPGAVFMTAAKTFLNAVGASAGPLYGTAFMRAGAALKGRESIDADGVADVVAAMAEGIQVRGKAEPGEKTMIDAWHPAAEAALAARASGDAAAIVGAAAEAAAAGAEATKTMIATKGRSANLGDRVLGHVDPGAASAAVLLKAMAGALSERS